MNEAEADQDEWTPEQVEGWAREIAPTITGEDGRIQCYGYDHFSDEDKAVYRAHALSEAQAWRRRLNIAAAYNRLDHDCGPMTCGMESFIEAAIEEPSPSWPTGLTELAKRYRALEAAHSLGLPSGTEKPKP